MLAVSAKRKEAESSFEGVGMDPVENLGPVVATYVQDTSKICDFRG